MECGEGTSIFQGWISDNHVASAQILQGTSIFQGWINDNHVASAQILLKQQFPQLGGLDFTLKQETKSLKPLLPNSLQVIHVDGNHWAAASTVNCKREDIMIYTAV